MTPEQIEEKLRENIKEGHMRFKQRLHFQNHLGEINIKADGSYKRGALNSEHLSHYPSPKIHSISISFREHLFTTYSRLIHPTLPFINLKRIFHAFQLDTEQEFSSPLLNAIYCRSFRYLQQSKSPGKVPPLEEDHFYKRCLQSLNHVPPTSPTLDSVQAEILISLEEFGQNLTKVSARRVSKILSKSHMLSLHDPASPASLFEAESVASDNMDTGDSDCNISQRIDLRFEKFTTWIAGVYADNFTSLFTKTYIHLTAQSFDCTQEMMFLENLSQPNGNYGTRGDSFAQSTNSYINECSAFSFPSPGLSSGSLQESPTQLDSECDAWIGRKHIYLLKLFPQFSFLMKRVLLIQRRLACETINAKELYDLQSELHEVSAAALNSMPPDLDHRVLSTTTLEDDSALVIKFLILLGRSFDSAGSRERDDSFSSSSQQSES
ncbi:hypothetical protein DSO57_1003826 [Entomophthora muscae]|nr:hypothetical protein DSO57_1003826 [Entomophthora muscae]